MESPTFASDALVTSQSATICQLSCRNARALIRCMHMRMLIGAAVNRRPCMVIGMDLNTTIIEQDTV